MTTLITKKGFEKLEKELENLKNIERPKVITDIAEARSHGDLKENSEYTAAKEKQRYVEGRINELEVMIPGLDVFDPSTIEDKTKVRFGAFVVVLNTTDSKEIDCQIVSDFEGDFNSHLISISSAFGKAIVGKQKGDKFICNGKKYEVLSVKY